MEMLVVMLAITSRLAIVPVAFAVVTLGDIASSAKKIADVELRQNTQQIMPLARERDPT